MNFSSKTTTQTLILLLFANSVNLIFIFAHLASVVVIRPIITYEYLLIPLLILFRAPVIVTFVFWLFVLALDLLNSVSSLFLFKLPDFVENLEFSLHYNVSFAQYLSLALFLAYICLNYWVLKKLSHAYPNKNAMIAFFLAFITLAFLLDYLNGSSRLTGHREKIAITRLNLGGSTIYYSGLMFSDFVSAAEPPRILPESVTFRTFANDTTGNQLVILVESWGLPDHEDDWRKVREALGKKALHSGWSAQFGSTRFDGSTTNAEMRELLSRAGNFRYLLDPDNARQIQSIFAVKKTQGYSTLAAHSFSGTMFWRSRWWKNIGIDSAFFLEEIVRRKKLSARALNYATPFISVNDEETFLFLSGIRTPGNKKKFVYLLTENTHLPFRDQTADSAKSLDPQVVSFEADLTEEGNGQLKRIQELLFFFMTTAQRNEWSAILIIGDHMAPFTTLSDREFYSPFLVPYVVLRPQ